jgi:tetratricopeptide (TPR) repeat protein
MRPHVGFAVLALVLFLLSAGACLAQDGLFASHMKAGKEFVDNGKYALALEEFKNAHRERPSSKGAVFNMSYCLLRLKRYEHAFDRFQAYIAMNPGSSKVKKARLFLDQIRGELTKTKALLTLETDPTGAKVYLDGKVQDVPRTPVAFWVEAGSREITLKRDGYEDLVTTLELAPGDEKVRSLTLKRKVVAANPVTPPIKVEPKTTGSNPWPWIVAGAGGALALGGGGVYLLGALPQFGDANAKYESGDEAGGDEEWDGAVGKMYATYALVGIGAAAVVGGVVWGLTSSGPATPPRTSFGITPLPGGAAASWGLVF